MARKIKSGQWKGQWYSRTTYRDRWGNIHRQPTTFRNRSKGYIITDKGTFIGIEPPRKHRYGRDERKIKKPITFVRANLPTALKPRSAHMRRM